MQFSRDCFFLSEFTTYQGHFLVPVCAYMTSFSCELSTQCSRDATSMVLSFHRLKWLCMRSWKRVSCSSSFTENQYFTRMMPERISSSSKIGHECKNS